MKRGGKTLVCLLCITALTAPVRAVVNDSPGTGDAPNNEGPYSAIWLRNVFDLKPAPPPKTNEPPPPAPPPNVTLNGITTIFGKKRALFTVKPAAVAGKPAVKDETYTLTEGERAGVLEVVEIDPKARNVKIKVDGEISTITFPTNAPPATAPAGAPQNAQGGIPRAPGFSPPPGFNPGATPFNNGGLPPRQVRPSADASPYTPQTGYNPASYQNGGYQGGYAPAVAGVATGGAATTPGLALPGFGNQTPVQTYRPPPEAAPPEVTGAMLILQQQAAQNAGVPFPPMLPPFQVGNGGPGSGPSGGSTGNGASSSGGPPSPPGLPPMPTYTQPVIHGNYPH